MNAVYYNSKPAVLRSPKRAGFCSRDNVHKMLNLLNLADLPIEAQSLSGLFVDDVVSKKQYLLIEANQTIFLRKI